MGCATRPVKDGADDIMATNQPVTLEKSVGSPCPGDVDPPADLADKFTAGEDADLLARALGKPDEGKLCQGKVYMANPESNVRVYRARNSTNPTSKMGKWWAFNIPEGKISQYRPDYEICYQWSPLDKLTICTLQADRNIVIGTGQSAECSQYLTYPASAKKQIYIEGASDLLIDCSDYYGEFSWKAVTE
ncbi:MAG: hypothetical protein GY869_29600 [Planctomycetes bacterium]|nr:hypothetical protein [Planctomycetota bacterium]